MICVNLMYLSNYYMFNTIRINTNKIINPNKSTATTTTKNKCRKKKMKNRMKNQYRISQNSVSTTERKKKEKKQRGTKTNANRNCFDMGSTCSAIHMCQLTDLTEIIRRHSNINVCIYTQCVKRDKISELLASHREEGE